MRVVSYVLDWIYFRCYFALWVFELFGGILFAWVGFCLVVLIDL